MDGRQKQRCVIEFLKAKVELIDIHRRLVKDDFFRPLLRQQNETVGEQGNVTVSFQDFLQYVVTDHHKNLGRTNWHWRSFHGSCLPCTLSYDYILTTDTWEEDMGFLIARLNITEMALATNHLHSLSDQKKKSPSYFRYYDGIPLDLMKTIYKIYEKDFKIFLCSHDKLLSHWQ
ncbi:carbohydrate sulfotransferase 12-like [Oratosquilla oratoria]|uniref:carbohydrate sulfotransferase 12-like n=1 Tax=Oratosquilla oratoria TaxID=337810 RepID=UPI003F771EE6